MGYNLTLVASDKSPELTEEHFRTIAYICGRHDIAIESSNIEWSPDGKAGRIKISNNSSMDMMKEMREALAADKIDCGVVDENFKAGLVISDWEGTGTKTECLDEMGEKSGVGDKIKAITSGGMNGKLDFEESLRRRVALVKGMPVSTLEEIRNGIKPNPGYLELIADKKAEGAVCALVTGGFTFYADKYAENWGFDHHHANVLEIENGTLTGKVQGAIVDKQAKADYARHYMKMYNVPPEQTMALGDGDNDRGMFAEVGLPIGYQPKQIVLDNTLNCVRYGNHHTARYFISKTMDLSVRPAPQEETRPYAEMVYE